MRRLLTLLISVLFLSLLGAASAASAGASSWQLNSPDGKIQIQVAIKEKLDPNPPGNRLYYSVLMDGKTVLTDSPIALEFKDQPPLARDLVLERESRQSINESWETVVGKSKKVLNRAEQLRLHLMESGSLRRKLEIEFRAYDDGIAFRYFLPSQPSLENFQLTAERTQFNFTGDHNTWAVAYNSYRSSQESEFNKTRLSQITSANIIGLPLLVELPDNHWAAITEANLRDWAGMYLTATGTDPRALVTTLAPRWDAPEVLVKARTPHYSPWRVLMLGRRVGALVESNLVLNLSDPSEVKDTRWIQAGRSAWDRWWPGDYAPEVDFKVGMNTRTMKYFTRLAAEMGWEYVIVDWTWYGNPENPEADITRPIPELDLQEVIRDARAQNVKVVLWARWNHVKRQREQAFPLYEKWGVSGVKIDFMDSDDQEMVNFYEETLRQAAQHHLVVDYHGAFKPTGLRRTFPNYITQEGVLGNEYNKWSNRVTPEHTVTLPFTRMLAGPMDFTPGGFRNISKALFRAQDSAPFVMGTRAHQLAMSVVYESPFQVYCDSPYNYRGQAGLDFLREAPTTWDETRALDGRVGEYVVIARRAGTRWFLGVMGNSEARTLEIPLDFLADSGKFKAHLYLDADECADYPDHLWSQAREVTAKETLKVKLAPGGGMAAWFELAN
jgi:alpha-glucosidase